MALATPDFLQVKTYTAKALRAALMDRAIQSGVYGGGDFMVTQRVAGANMTVDVALGSAWVLGTTSSRQGAYHVYNDAAITGTAINSNASGNPRIDQVVLHVYDSIDGGAGTDVAAIEVIQGTATPGATLNNRTGAAALPANCLLLADVLVANGAGSIGNAAIRDRRPFARGYFARTVYTSSNATNGTLNSLAAINASLQVRAEATGNPFRFLLQAIGNNNVTNNITATTVFEDGAAIDGATSLNLVTNPTPGGLTYNHGFTYTKTPAAGSHLYVPAFGPIVGGTATINAGVVNPVVFTVEELLRQNTPNNTTTTG